MTALSKMGGWINGNLLLAALLCLRAATIAAEPPPPQPTTAPDWRSTVRNFSASHFKNPAWGFSHSMRDYALARALAATDHQTLDDDILFAAAFLHDIAAFPPWEKADLDHSDCRRGHR